MVSRKLLKKASGYLDNVYFEVFLKEEKYSGMLYPCVNLGGLGDLGGLWCLVDLGGLGYVP